MAELYALTKALQIAAYQENRSRADSSQPQSPACGIEPVYMRHFVHVYRSEEFIQDRNFVSRRPSCRVMNDEVGGAVFQSTRSRTPLVNLRSFRGRAERSVLS